MGAAFLGAAFLGAAFTGFAFRGITTFVGFFFGATATGLVADLVGDLLLLYTTAAPRPAAVPASILLPRAARAARAGALRAAPADWTPLNALGFGFSVPPFPEGRWTPLNALGLAFSVPRLFLLFPAIFPASFLAPLSAALISNFFISV